MLVSVLLLRSKMNDGRASERWFGIASSYGIGDVPRMKKNATCFLRLGWATRTGTNLTSSASWRSNCCTPLHRLYAALSTDGTYLNQSINARN